MSDDRDDERDDRPDHGPDPKPFHHAPGNRRDELSAREVRDSDLSPVWRRLGYRFSVRGDEFLATGRA